MTPYLMESLMTKRMDIGDDKQSYQKLQLGVEDECWSSSKHPVQ